MFIFFLIPVLPLLASLALAMGGRRWGEYSHRVAIPAIGFSFGLSVLAFLEVIRHGPISISLYRLFQSGSLVIDLNLYLDQLSVLLLLLVTGVSSVVHVYSSRYMIGDPRYNRFFSVIALFTSSMLMLVISGNLLMLFICWEIMGICSYLLISHWSERRSACQAATKAFIVNAVADVGLGFGIILTFFTFGTLDIQQIFAQAESMHEQTINLLGWMGVDLPVHALTLIPLFLFLGAMGKSAQIPFHVWLPFAMEAPTPVSALIHAATMVNAGPFLLIRLSPLIVYSPVAMTVIAVTGAITALFAGLVSLTQSDIKKNLAYSTISQIGFMIMTCGIGAFVAATFHLLAHGFLKAFLFLSTGNALRSLHPHHHDEVRHASSPNSPWLLYMGALILACLPPIIIFSGPYELLWTSHGFASSKILFWSIGLTTVFFTALYLFRGIISIFQHGPAGGFLVNANPTMAQPQFFSPSHLLGVLVGAGVMTCLLVLLWTWFAEFLSPALGQPIPALNASAEPGQLSSWIMIPFVVALCGWGFAYWLHTNSTRIPLGQSELGKTLYMLFFNKWYFDEIYDAYVVQPTLRFSRWLWRTIDLGGIDRFVMGIASVSVSFARWLWQIVDIKGIDRIVVGIGQHSVGLSRWLWQIVDIRWLERNIDQVGKGTDTAGQLLQEVESRTIQHQLLVMVFWLVLATGILYMLV